MGASDYATTTYGTWDISMQKIEMMAQMDAAGQAHAAQTAIKILRIFAFLDHAKIPEELFRNAAENYMKRDLNEEAKSDLPLSIGLLNYQTLFLSDEGVWEISKFLAGIRVLISFALIEADSQLYSMHQVVHAWNRYRVPKAELTDIYETTTALLSCSVVLDYGIDNYAFCQLLAPHVRSIAFHASELALQKAYYDDEYEKFMLVFHHVGSWDEMEKLLLVTAEWRTTTLGAEHPKTLDCTANLAFTYMSQGRLDEAEKLGVDVMNARKKIFGSDHPKTFFSMMSLASTCWNQGRWDEAEKLQVDATN